MPPPTLNSPGNPGCLGVCVPANTCIHTNVDKYRPIGGGQKTPDGSADLSSQKKMQAEAGGGGGRAQAVLWEEKLLKLSYFLLIS